MIRIIIIMKIVPCSAVDLSYRLWEEVSAWMESLSNRLTPKLSILFIKNLLHKAIQMRALTRRNNYQGTNRCRRCRSPDGSPFPDGL